MNIRIVIFAATVSSFLGLQAGSNERKALIVKRPNKFATLRKLTEIPLIVKKTDQTARNAAAQRKVDAQQRTAGYKRETRCLSVDELIEQEIIINFLNKCSQSNHNNQ